MTPRASGSNAIRFRTQWTRDRESDERNRPWHRASRAEIERTARTWLKETSRIRYVSSSIDEVVRDVAATVAAERALEISIAPVQSVAAECAAEAAEHRHALYRLLTLAAAIVTEPRALYLVIRPDGEPVTRLHIRGEGLPRMFAGVPDDQAVALRDVAAEVKTISARLMVDQGGLLVLYGHFAPDDP